MPMLASEALLDYMKTKKYSNKMLPLVSIEPLGIFKKTRMSIRQTFRCKFKGPTVGAKSS